jgi:predicted MPP superfamily phosphohydrolase
VRLLHTSDWQVGRSFHGVLPLEEQDAAIKRIAELADDYAVDAVLIAGDLYDRAIPPAEEVEHFNKALAQLSRDGTAVVAIAGNQDSRVLESVTTRCSRPSKPRSGATWAGPRCRCWWPTCWLSSTHGPCCPITTATPPAR